MTTFFLFFLFIHHISGVIYDKIPISVAGVSIVGFCNIFASFFLIINLPYISRKNNLISHAFSVCIAPYVLLGTISIILGNFSILSLFKFISNTVSLISIYYLSQFFFSNITNFRKKIIFFLKVIFVFASAMGFFYIIKYGFYYINARQYAHNNNFIFFEFPHSFGIFISCLTPLFVYFIENKNVNRRWYWTIMVFVPLSLYFSGARIAIILYLLTTSASSLLPKKQKITYKIFSYIIVCLLFIVFLQSEVFMSLKNIFSLSIIDYENAYYNLNSFHTRLLVWDYMVKTVIDNNALLFGLGWGSWSTTYLDLSRFVSSQSDYITRFFDIGIVGIVGYLFYKILVILYFLRKITTNDNLGTYLTIGIICSLYIGGISEAADGYATTSWLIPLLFSVEQKIKEDSSTYFSKENELNPHNYPQTCCIQE